MSNILPAIAEFLLAAVALLISISTGNPYIIVMGILVAAFIIALGIDLLKSS